MKTLLYLLAVVSLALRAQTPPEALDLLVRSDGPIFTAKTVRLVGTRSSDSTAGATPIHNSSSFSYEFQSDGRAREEVQAGNSTNQTIFDGSNLWRYYSASQIYTKVSAKQMPSTQAGFEYLEYGRNSANIISAKIDGEEQLTFGGKPATCYIVVASYGGFPGNPRAQNVTRKVWISRDQNLVLRDNWIYEAPAGNAAIKFSNLIGYTTVEWDLAIAAERFAFEPPAGSRPARQFVAPTIAAPAGIGAGGGIGNGRGPVPPPPAALVLVTRIEPEYTAEARAAGLQGIVSLFLSVQADGVPANVHVMHGLGLGLDEKAVQAVQQWRFKPGTASAGQSAELSFHLDDGGPWRIRLAAYSVKRDNMHSEILAKPLLSRYTAPDPAACPAGGGSAIVAALVGTNGSPREIRPEIAGDPLGEAAAKAIKSWRFQPGTANGKPREANASIEFECGPFPPPAVAGVSPTGNGVANPVPIYRPEPQYSEEARKAKWQGAVLLSLIVDATGHTTAIRVVRPLGMGLDEKAIEAVKLWRFKPGMRGAQPVAIQAQIEVTFRLL